MNRKMHKINIFSLLIPTIIGLFFLTMAPKTGYATELVYADEALARAGNADPINISLEDDQVLVFRENDNEKYVLNGRSLEINAKKVEVVGQVVIKAFTYAATNGAVGATGTTATAIRAQGGGGDVGAEGEIGVSAKKITLNIRNIVVNNGLLTIENNGQNGGTGGRGGRGGTGGPGGTGGSGSRFCAPFGGSCTCIIAGIPSIGGTGGPGGPGGNGGNGGDGGGITYHGSLQIAIDRGLIQFSSTGGAGGVAGTPGLGGAGGAPGPAGSPCGTAGLMGLPGPFGIVSDGPGTTGSAGVVSSF